MPECIAESNEAKTPNDMGKEEMEVLINEVSPLLVQEYPP